MLSSSRLLDIKTLDIVFFLLPVLSTMHLIVSMKQLWQGAHILAYCLWFFVCAANYIIVSIGIKKIMFNWIKYFCGQCENDAYITKRSINVFSRGVKQLVLDNRFVSWHSECSESTRVIGLGVDFSRCWRTSGYEGYSGIMLCPGFQSWALLG